MPGKKFDWAALCSLIGIALAITALIILVSMFLSLSGAHADQTDPRQEAFIVPPSVTDYPSAAFPRGAFPFPSNPRIVVPIPPTGDPTDDGTVGHFLNWRELQQQRVAQALVDALSNINFKFDSAEVEDQYLPLVERVVQLLAANPEIALTLAGHTDLVGGDEYNTLLGTRRAEALQRLLLDHGVGPERVQVVSYGKTLPLRSIPQATRENRRVEIIPYKRY